MRVNFYRSQKGSSLLEVLITMLIMSFGLLALSGLTASSLQYSKMAQFQTIGSQLALEYGDRMRGNVAGFQAGYYNQIAAYPGATSLDMPSCATAATEATGATEVKCSPEDVAKIDIAEWTKLLRQRLPGGGAYVLRDVASPLSVDIWVMWVEPNLAVNGSSDTLSVSATGGNQCPADAKTDSVSPVPRCMYFRVSL